MQKTLVFAVQNIDTVPAWTWLLLLCSAVAVILVLMIVIVILATIIRKRKEVAAALATVAPTQQQQQANYGTHEETSITQSLLQNGKMVTIFIILDFSQELNDSIVKVAPQLRKVSVLMDELTLEEQIGAGMIIFVVITNLLLQAAVHKYTRPNI